MKHSKNEYKKIGEDEDLGVVSNNNKIVNQHMEASMSSDNSLCSVTDHSSSDHSRHNIVTRSGRHVRVPKRFEDFALS